MSHAKKNGNSTALRRFSSMTMPTTAKTANMPRTKLSNVICFFFSIMMIAAKVVISNEPCKRLPTFSATTVRVALEN